jgi:hypothetical protein
MAPDIAFCCAFVCAPKEAAKFDCLLRRTILVIVAIYCGMGS